MFTYGMQILFINIFKCENTMFQLLEEWGSWTCFKKRENNTLISYFLNPTEYSNGENTIEM